jgi:cold-inducible RNA-binding protein
VSSARLYVGNLTYETTDASLEALFASHGEVVSANVITDRDSGRSKGFGFVEMSTTEEAQSAKSSLDGSDLEGRSIKVDVAKERAPRSNNGGDAWRS